MNAQARKVWLLAVALAVGCDSNATGPGTASPVRPAFQVVDEDVTDPVLTALSFSPASINTTTGSAVVTVSFTVTDDVSGATNICGVFMSPSGLGRGGCSSFAPSTNHSGTFDINFPPFGESGTWRLLIHSFGDAASNERGYSATELADAGFPTDLDVTSVLDNTDPEVTALSFSPAAINTTTGSAVVTVSFTVADDVSGATNICGVFMSPSGLGRGGCSAFSPSTSHSGTFEIHFPQIGESGTWKLLIHSFGDAAGNERGYSAAEVANAGFPTDLDVISLEDVTDPVVTALSFSPVAINPTTGSAFVTVSFTVADDVSGATNICGVFMSPSMVGRGGCSSFAPSTSHSGTFDIHFTQFDEAGTWKLLIHSFGDAAGNERGYSAADLANAGFPTDLLVIRAEPVPLYLHGSGATANPPTLFLDDAAPAGTTAKHKDSPSINIAGGNPWKDVGTWNASPAVISGTVGELSDVHLWIGLKNSDDAGTRFDVRVEVQKNGATFATGEILCVQNVVRNPMNAKEVIVAFAPFSEQAFNGTSDVLSLRVRTRVGTNGSGGSCGGHSNATGLRTYLDSTTRPARFGATF